MSRSAAWRPEHTWLPGSCAVQWQLQAGRQVGGREGGQADSRRAGVEGRAG